MNKKVLIAAKENGVNVDKVHALQNEGNRDSRRGYGKRSGFSIPAKLSKKK